MRYKKFLKVKRADNRDERSWRKLILSVDRPTIKSSTIREIISLKDDLDYGVLYRMPRVRNIIKAYSMKRMRLYYRMIFKSGWRGYHTRTFINFVSTTTRKSSSREYSTLTLHAHGAIKFIEEE